MEDLRDLKDLTIHDVPKFLFLEESPREGVSILDAPPLLGQATGGLLAMLKRESKRCTPNPFRPCIETCLTEC